MVYPEKPSPKQPWRVGTGNSAMSGEKRFRIGKNQRDNFWQENIDHWVQSENPQHSEDICRQNRNGNHHSPLDAPDRKHTCTSSHHSETSDSAVLSKEFVHHQGFQGSPESQSTNLKYKFGKKKATTSKENANQPNTFRPKGFGSLYDELEFERRYKKVIDLNKHIHFVHSNFVTGQRLYKRSKLPPIGHIPSVQSDPTDSRDIFAIMSVQRFNHPDEQEIPRAPVASPGQNQPHGADGFPTRRPHKRNPEITQELNVPVGFVPGTIKSTGNSPFDGVSGSIMQKDGGYRLAMASRENDSALESLTEETGKFLGGDDLTCSISERSTKSITNKKTKLLDDTKARRSPKKSRQSTKEENHNKYTHLGYLTDQQLAANQENTFEEQEPFNISVHVEIKAKDPNINGGDDMESERARERRLPIIEQPESPVSDNSQDNTEKIMFATKPENELSPRLEKLDDGTKILRPKNIAVNTNQFGLVTHKVQYPERFIIEESLAEEDEGDTELDNDGNEENLGENKYGQAAE